MTSKAPVPTKKPETKVAAKTTRASAAKADNSQDKAEVRTANPAPVSQTTDAATLAAIDTSGYVLPSVKVPGRRGRKPKEFTPENDEIAALNAVERAELKAADKAKAITCPDIGGWQAVDREIGACTCISAPSGCVLLR